MSEILRVFQAEVKPGTEDEFKQFFLEEVLPMVREHDGLVSVQVGLPMERKATRRRYGAEVSIRPRLSRETPSPR